MLTLFTGVPGAGKGMAGVALVRDLVAKGRPLFVLEVPEQNVEPVSLKLPHTLLGPGEVERWQELVPDGCVVYAPEAQRIWPARSPSSRVPAHAEAVGQHRHRNIDMVLDTQDPKLIDDKVRLRVGRHVHVRDLGVLGRHWYEWPECANPERWKSAPIKKKFRPEKGVRDLYTSATAHTKPVRSFPPSMIVLGVALLVLFGLAARLLYRWLGSEAAYTAPVAAAASAASSASIGSAVSSFLPGRTVQSQAPQWPLYSSGPVKEDREPYELRALQIEGEYSVGAARHVVFGLVIQGQRVATVPLVQLLRAGYVWTHLAPCSGLLRWGEVERLVTCALPGPSLPSRPSPGASAPHTAPA